MNMFTTMAITVFAISACGLQNQNSELNQAGTTASSDGMIAGQDGADFMLALQNTGVKPVDPRVVGSWNLAVKQVSCDSPVVPSPVPGCMVKLTDGKTLRMSAKDARKVTSILGRAGALVSDSRVGSAHYEANNVKCSRLVHPGSTGRCAFTKARTGHVK